MKDCECSIRGGKALRQRRRTGMVADRKILQPSIAVQTHASGTDSSNGHCDLSESVAAEGALWTQAEKVCARITAVSRWVGLRRGGAGLSFRTRNGRSQSSRGCRYQELPAGRLRWLVGSAWLFRLHQGHPLFSLCRIQPQEARRIVVKDVALLLRCEVVGLVNNADGGSHEFRPDHLIRAEHHTIFKSGFDNTPDVHIHFLERIAPDQASDINVNMRICLQEREQVVDHWVAGVHDPKP